MARRENELPISTMDGSAVLPNRSVLSLRVSTVDCQPVSGAGFSDGTLETTAKVSLDKDGDGFKVTRSALTLTASVPGIDQAKFEEIAAGAKAGCPISKLLNAEITLEHHLTA